MEYNVINQSAAAAFATVRVGVISRVPLNRGFLSGRFDESSQFADDDTRKRSLTPEKLRKFQGQLDAVKAAAAELGVSPAELAIRFCASNANVSCVIPGVRTVAQAEQNAAAAQPLPADVMQKLLEQ
jgi:aryl-alcohol dehydrogenase-like predicted oxidoreductase